MLEVKKENKVDPPHNNKEIGRKLMIMKIMSIVRKMRRMIKKIMKERRNCHLKKSN